MGPPSPWAISLNETSSTAIDEVVDSEQTPTVQEVLSTDTTRVTCRHLLVDGRSTFWRVSPQLCASRPALVSPEFLTHALRV
jgi:hypothetical protein